MFLNLSYFYSFLIFRSEQGAGTYSVARPQVADSRRPLDVHICVRTCVYVYEYACACMCVWACVYTCIG